MSMFIAFYKTISFTPRDLDVDFDRIAINIY